MWTIISTVYTENLTSVFFRNQSLGWAVGFDGRILKTTDGGQTWISQTSGTTANLFSVSFVSDSKGWAVGNNGTIISTIDGGLTWNSDASGVSSSISLFGVFFRNQSLGWAVGSNGTILKYTAPVSTLEETDKLFVNIYPNPIDKIVNVEFENYGKYQLQLIDMSGKIIQNFEVNAQNVQMNSASWSAGVYRLNITNDKGQMSNKTIVKQ
jgi:hypothetical protein